MGANSLRAADCGGAGRVRRLVWRAVFDLWGVSRWRFCAFLRFYARARAKGGRVLKLTAKQREALEALLFERQSTADIQAAMLERFGLTLSHQVVSYHRGRLAPALQAGDLEAVQVGAAAFPLLVGSLAVEIQALHDAAVTKEGKLAAVSGAAFSLLVAGQLRRELRELQMGAYDRLGKRQQHEDRMEIERARLAIEREKWGYEKWLIDRERALMEQEDAVYAAEVSGDKKEEGGGENGN
jgi:hypothetical protein